MEVKTWCVIYGFCFITLLIQSSTGNPVKDVKKITMVELRDIVAKVPTGERKAFIKAKIDLGYRIQQLGESTDDQEEATLAVQIFNYFVENQEAILQRKQITDSIIVAETVCYPEPIGCIDPDDPGIRP
ncbi:uncharacterized protein LOC126735193 [Anthonomus grandis grandis]|uniref:uncharacterized protein LOC126735193 n=1 Tax=Anthonomus grandis grandis TaxID=2921223 RepID=UPI0021668DC2|nr:uncharacterized protein LOC126735193 [Anthonomus grandis grandis]